MTLKERILKKIFKLEREKKELSHVVILGREEYYEYQKDPSNYPYFLKIDSPHEWIMGLRITRSRRPRYLAVLPKRLSKKIGWYCTWRGCINKAKAVTGIIVP